MNKNMEEFLEETISKIASMGYIHSDDIPSIDLYMDQVTGFLEKKLASSKRRDEDKILTKTMINNYAKNNLLPPPVKKKYSKDHIVTLLFIYYLKNILSINDIESIIGPLTENFFSTSDDQKPNMSDVYEEVFSIESKQIASICKDIREKYDHSLETFSDSSLESKEELRNFSFLCTLLFDIYIKKSIVESFIDEMIEKK